jgi:succinate dehydrogenase / fumarate reductase cytochrome b subunit
MEQTSMSQTNRPLSPHLQIYRPQLTSVLSISHRASGIVLGAGALALTLWLLALASGPEAFARASAVFGSIPGKLLMFLFTLALFYHLCNGVRHLFWDAGYGFELETAYASGKAAVAASAILTLALWGFILAGGGA